MPYLVRLSLYRSAVQSLQRGMMKVELSEAQLSTLQQRVEGAVGQHGLVRALAGERVASLASFDESKERLSATVRAVQLMTGVAVVDRLAYLRLMRRGIEAANDRGELIDSTQFVEDAKTLGGPDYLWQVMAPVIARAIQVDQQWRTSSQTTTAMLAIRRYQLAHGQSPQNWQALVPGFLAAVPTDLYTGEPLQYQQRGDKLYVFSRGPDGKGTGGPRSTEAGIAFVVPQSP